MKVTRPKPPKMRTLHCERGDHDWKSPVKRGKPPANCPDHPRPVEQKAPKADDSVGAALRWVRDTRDDDYSRCDCGLTEDMTREQIRKLGAGCTGRRGGGWVCPVLDAVRRRIGYGPDS